MKLMIGNKTFNFNQGGFDKLSPCIVCYHDFTETTIDSHFYFIARNFKDGGFIGNRWFYSQKTCLSKCNITINIDEFYRSLKSQINVYCFNEDQKEEIINSIIDEKIRMLL